MKKLDNKTIVITGAAGRIGSYFCEVLVESGANVIATDINERSLNLIAGKYPNSIQPAVMDITNKESIDNLINDISKKFGTIDAIVNNAYPRNKNYGALLEDVKYDDFCENVDMHLGGYFLVSQRFALYFKHKNKGNIINMSSI